MKLKQYPKYKESDVQWIGKIPEEWGVFRFKLKFKYAKGRIPKNLEENSSENHYPYLSMDYLRGKENAQIQYSIKDLSAMFVKDNDILLLWDGSNAGEFVIGKTGYLSSTMVKLLPQEINSKYSNYLCGAFQCILQDLTIGMGIPHVNSDTLDNIRLPIQSQKEQSLMASFLDTKSSELDSLISKDQHLIDLLKEKRIALINHVVTKGLNPKAKMKDSGIEWIGKVPEQWQVKRLKHFGKILGGYAFPSGEFVEEGVRVIKITNIQPFSFDWNDNSYLPEDYAKRYKDYFAIKGDVIFALTRPIISTGIKIAYYEDDELSIVNQRTGIFKPNHQINLKYLFYYFFSKSFYDDFALKITETNQPNISPEDVGLVRICVPTNSEQLQISSYLDKETSKIDQTIEKIEKKIELLEEYKKSLIHHVVTGKVDVREATA